MTKAKARLRAKAKAAKKARKRAAGGGAGRPGPKAPPGRFDPGPGSIKGPHGADVPSLAGARRGAPRSR